MVEKKQNAKQEKKPLKLTKQVKQILVGTGVVSLLVGGGIGAAIMNATSPNKTVLTTNYGTIKQSQIFSRIKSIQPVQTAGQALVMEQVLENYFPNAATDKKVNQQFKKLKANQMTYMQAAQQYGDDQAIKDNIKDSLLLNAAMKKEIKVSDAQVKKAYKDYRPNMMVAYIEADSKAKAEQFQPMLAQSHSYSEFKEQAQELSQGDSKHISAGILPEFSSLTSEEEMPSVVKNAAMKMQKNETSGVVKTGNGKYAVLFMKSATDKGSYAKEKGAIKKALIEQQMSSDTVRAKVLAKYGKKANVKANDSAFKDLAKSFAK